MTTWFSAEAKEDLVGVEDPSVMAQLIDLARKELAHSPSLGPIEGPLPPNRGLWWRRAVRRTQVQAFLTLDVDGEDEFAIQPFNYVFIYREVTTGDGVDGRASEGALIVVRVCHNREIAESALASFLLRR